ncbi:hypothetical protein N7516_005794 [Penicillium verrucosum]|uniref:uncharacterized protein n=1 Tax=Penicillium verrucosum TaxID=60171 RepID=UPI002545483C|nr:uncharacterized protein N7516_005794 [Penicillium verrucosum]KAJ5931305.1 hypothetical protein N7516_005794 [Penicillium verrucosum]
MDHREAFCEGDLVLVRDLRREKVSKDKMMPKWFGPRKLIRINPRRSTAMISRLYGGKTTKYHLDDLRPFHQRDLEEFHFRNGEEIQQEPPPPLHIERSAVTMALLIRQRSIDLRWA